MFLESWTAIFRRSMRSGLLVVQFAILLLLNCVSWAHRIKVYAYLSFVTFLLWAIQVFVAPYGNWNEDLTLFLPSCHNWYWDIDRCHSRTDTSMWFTLDLQRWERSSATLRTMPVEKLFHWSTSQHQLWLEVRNRGKFFIPISIQSYKIPELLIARKVTNDE